MLDTALLLLLLLVPLASAAKPLFANFQLLYTSDWSKQQNQLLRFNRRLPKEFSNVQIVWNGLGVFSVGNRTLQHAFDGLAKLAKIDFTASGDQRGHFTSQLLRTRQLRESVAANDIAPYLMFESVVPPFTQRQKLQSMLNGLDNANVNVVRLSAEEAASRSANASLLAVNDYARCYEVRLNDLSTIRRVEVAVDGNDLSKLSQISSAHPLREASSGQLLNYITSVSPLQPLISGSLQLVRYSAAGVAERVAEWKTSSSPYMHSFSATRSYAIVFAAPLYIDVVMMLKTAQPFKSLRWLPHLPSDVVVIRLSDGQVRRLRIKEGRFLMHHINAFESHNATRLTFYATAYPDTSFFLGLELGILNDDKLRNKVPVNSELRKYTINLVSGSVKSELIQPPASLSYLKNLEMPTINEAYRYSKNCFVYGIVMKSDGSHLANITLAKRNLCGRAEQEDRLWFRRSHYPCEPHFVPRRQAVSEDDGFLVTIVLDGNAHRSYVAVFDARDLLLISRAWLPVALPYRLHGSIFFN